jgi:hypothetical protein
MIRKGEILGELADPAEFFDRPETPEGMAKLRRATALIQAVIEANLHEGEPPVAQREAKKTTVDPSKPHIHTNSGDGRPPGWDNEMNGVHIRDAGGNVPNKRGVMPNIHVWDEEGNVPDKYGCIPVSRLSDQPEEEEAEDYGPKTAAMPDNTVYPLSKMEELLDIGSLPNHLKERAWAMLKKRVKAFGFDGRLGHVDAKAPIRTVDGQQPIAVPMYNSSPEKQRVIDEQLEKRFEQGVIEPSISPWSAPVVIAYHNGKPRFCVDYHKLNAVMIADEFPIPRQSEILSSLSGAQVLSGLDALAGFNQMEINKSDVEKTAFRTHRGLAQFLQMPFRL